MNDQNISGGTASDGVTADRTPTAFDQFRSDMTRTIRAEVMREQTRNALLLRAAEAIERHIEQGCACKSDRELAAELRKEAGNG